MSSSDSISAFHVRSKQGDVAGGTVFMDVHQKHQCIVAAMSPRVLARQDTDGVVMNSREMLSMRAGVHATQALPHSCATPVKSDASCQDRQSEKSAGLLSCKVLLVWSGTVHA